MSSSSITDPQRGADGAMTPERRSEIETILDHLNYSWTKRESDAISDLFAEIDRRHEAASNPQRGAAGGAGRVCDNPDCNRTATHEEATLFWLYVRGRSDPLWFCSWVCVHAFAEPMAQNIERN